MALALLDHGGDVDGLELVDLAEEAGAGAKADDDPGDAEEEGLDPVPEELAREVVPVAIGPDLDRRLELDPVDGVAELFGLRVPDLGCGREGGQYLGVGV